VTLAVLGVTLTVLGVTLAVLDVSIAVTLAVALAVTLEVPFQRIAPQKTVLSNGGVGADPVRRVNQISKATVLLRLNNLLEDVLVVGAATAAKIRFNKLRNNNQSRDVLVADARLLKVRILATTPPPATRVGDGRAAATLSPATQSQDSQHQGGELPDRNPPLPACNGDMNPRQPPHLQPLQLPEQTPRLRQRHRHQEGLRNEA
jgi:hypothetical protein